MTPGDHFATQAASYAAHRPTYPRALFDAIARLAPNARRVWDCATGSGQAAVGLAAHFPHVIATDSSCAQIAYAARHARITYHVARAEASGIADRAVGVVTVAQALHWFDVDAFYGEVQRVVAPGGVIVVWSYGDAVIDDPAAHEVFRRFEREVVGPYWPAERELVREAYADIPFPFRALPMPPVTLEREWTMEELMGYVRTWSATARFVAARGHDPLPALAAPLSATWAPAARRTVRWPVMVRAGAVA